MVLTNLRHNYLDEAIIVRGSDREDALKNIVYSFTSSYDYVFKYIFHNDMQHFSVHLFLFFSKFILY